jgi:hypothetical protein
VDIGTTTGSHVAWLRLTGLAVFNDDPDVFDSVFQAFTRLKSMNSRRVSTGGASTT